MAKIVVKDQTIKTINKDGIDYICITDIAKQKNGEDPNGIIGNWMRNRNTIEFLGIWEELYNPNFNPIEFEGFRKEAGLNAFTMSPTKWVESTNAIGITAMSGRYGGTYAISDIAFEFASWISVEFKHKSVIISLSDNEAARRLRFTPLLSSSKFPAFSASKCLQNSSIIQNNSVTLQSVVISNRFVTCCNSPIKVQNICETTNFL